MHERVVQAIFASVAVVVKCLLGIEEVIPVSCPAVDAVATRCGSSLSKQASFPVHDHGPDFTFASVLPMTPIARIPFHNAQQ